VSSSATPTVASNRSVSSTSVLVCRTSDLPFFRLSTRWHSHSFPSQFGNEGLSLTLTAYHPLSGFIQIVLLSFFPPYQSFCLSLQFSLFSVCLRRVQRSQKSHPNTRPLGLYPFQYSRVFKFFPFFDFKYGDQWENGGRLMSSVFDAHCLAFSFPFPSPPHRLFAFPSP